MAKEKLTPADKKFITKFFGEVDFDATDIKRRNPFTSVEISVDPVFAKCFDFVMQIQKALNNQSKPVLFLSSKQDRLQTELKQIHADLKETNVIMNFDRARMIALKMDADAYMELLD